MKKFSMLTTALAGVVMMSASAVYAQTAAPAVNCPTPVKHHGKKKPAVAPCADFESQLAKQQAEIDALKAQIAGQQPAATPAEVDPIATPLAKQASADAADAANKAAAASAAAQAASAQATATDAAYKAEAKKLEDEIESPLAIHYKGVLITPVGFAAAESVYRNRVFNSDIATPFNSLPYKNSDNAYLSEWNGSARQSRLGVNVVAPFSWGKAGAYYEMDFLGAGTTSNNNQTNSYLLRVRSAFAQATLNNGFSVQAGQMFTLATEVKKGILAGPGAEALPPTIDPNYMVGFEFGRQWAMRFAQSFFGGKANAAFAIEESQAVVVGSGLPDNFLYGGQGATGGLFNSVGSAGGAQNYTDNLIPDLHVKVTADPGYGHFELGGIARVFRDRVYAQTAYSTTVAGTTANVYNNLEGGGGVYASARVPATKYADLGLKVVYGKGIGRYEASNLGDVTANQFGEFKALKTGSGLFELDLHPTKKLDVFFLGGAAYLGRLTYLSSTGVQVGYAGITTQNDSGCSTQVPPTAGGTGTSIGAGSCTGNTRYLAEFIPGITYRFFSSPTKGRLQFQVTSEYLDREAWQGYTGSSFATSTAAAGQFHGPQATAEMVHTSFRYYLP